jgi:hypothetical protein
VDICRNPGNANVRATGTILYNPIQSSLTFLKPVQIQK